MTIYETAEKPVPQIKSSQAALGFGSVLLGAFLMILLTALCYRVLPESVAKELSEQIWEMIKTAAIGGGVIGALGVSVRGLMLTKDLIEKNKVSAINEPLTDAIPPTYTESRGIQSAQLPVEWPQNADRSEFEENQNIEVIEDGND